ncbi:site-specific integrase [Acinetobacter baumannii]|nr:site-specific integrase [Acinetobacter baumannii]
MSTQHADLIALKFWYDFWFEKFATSFCESFYSSSYNFEIIQTEIDNFIIYLENNKKIESNLIRLRNTDHTNYTTIGHRIRSFLKFYSFLIDEYLTIQSQPQLSLKEIQKIKENLNKYMTIKKKIINNFSKSNKTIKSEINYSFKSMNDEMIKVLYLIISPSNSNKYNTLNPFKSKNVQLRNFLIIHLMLNYGLRIGELMLLTTNSIKKSIQNHNFSLIITNTDDEFDDRSKKPKIKNEYSYRVIKLQERDYRILQIYINEIRKEIPSQILFTSLKPPYSALSYASVKKIFDQVDLSLKALLPECFDTSAYDSIDRLTPHVCRHSWAYMMLTPQWFELFLQNWIHNKLTVTQAVYETNKHFYSSNNDPSKYLALSIFGNPFKRY